jgi:Na+/melibiose symporter-like transporter
MAKGRINRGQLLAFALPSIPISALGLPIVVYLPPFYAEDMGLSLSLVGWIFMIARFWDVFTDPVLGTVSDRIHSPWGRRRHWIVISTPILMFSAWMLFMPQGQVSGLYLFGWMVVLYVGWTLITISHMSWGAELSPDYDERSTIQGWREFALIFGSFTVLALPALVEFAADGAGSADSVAAMGWFVIILLPLTVGIAVWAVPEFKSVPQAAINWMESGRLLVRNTLLRRVLLADLLVGVAPGITGSLYIFFASYVMDLPKWASLLLLVYFVAGFVGVPIWLRVSHHFGKHRTLAIAMFYGAIALPLVVFMPRGEFWWLFFGNVLYGIAYGAGSFLLRAIMADVCDKDLLETGQQRTGLYYSLLTMTNKIGFALAVGITYPILDLIGFVAEPGANSAETLNQLLLLYVSLPALFMLAAGFVMWNYPLTKAAQEEMRRQLADRHHDHDTAADAAAAVSAVATTIHDRPAD